MENHKPPEEWREVKDTFGKTAYENIRGNDNDDQRFIRLEKDFDPSLKALTSKDDVIRKITDTKQRQTRFSVAELYPREWANSSVQSGKKRKLADSEDNEESRTKENSIISIAQFNILAEGLSAGPNAKTPFLVNSTECRGKRDRTGHYGGFSSILHPEVSLDFDSRRWRLLEVILGSSGDAPFDLIGMEEVDRFHGFFLPALSMFGYDGSFLPKKNSPGVKLGWYSDGSCLFWKRDQFEFLFEKQYEFNVGNQVFLVVALKLRETQKPILVCVTHLKAQRSESNENTRLNQVEDLLRHLESERKEFIIETGLSDVPIFILGDFNADPPSENNFKVSSIKQMLDYKVDGDGQSESSCILETLYKSAYEINPPPDSFYTTWKTRGSKTAKRIIDYIFFRGPTKCVDTLQVPKGDELEPTKLPGFRYPSDHMLIAAKFEI